MEEEAIRELPRAREEALSACQDAKCRLQAFVLRQESRDTGRAHWGPAPLRWLAEGVCPTPPPQIVLQDSVRAVPAHPARLQRLAPALREPVNAWRVPPVVEARQALRGVPWTVAVTMVADMGDLPRFETPRALMKCMGLIPAASSSGAPRRQGAMTQAGPTPARQALVEGAWASRSPAQVRRPLHLRREKHPKVLQASRGKAPVRLWKRSRQRVGRGQPAPVVTVAMARARVGCRWAMAQQVWVTPSVQKIRRIQPSTPKVDERASAAPPPRCGGTLGGVQRLGTDPRAEREAGPRRRPGRWDPTPGEPQDHPSSLPGSDSSAARRLNKPHADLKKVASNSCHWKS